MKDTSRSLCYPVYVVIVFYLVKQSAKPLGFLFIFDFSLDIDIEHCVKRHENLKLSKEQLNVGKFVPYKFFMWGGGALK